MTDTSIWRLPDNPPTIRLLRTDESRALDLRYPQSVRPVSRCVTCEGKKTFQWYAPGTRDVVTFECPCKEQYVLSRWLWHCGILLRYQRLGWEDFEHLPDDVATKVADYLSYGEEAVRRGLGLIVTGPKGNGKTLLAHLIVKEMVAKGIEVYATSFSHMIDHFAGGWSDKDQARWFNQRLRDVPLLYIDDLGRERNQTRADDRAKKTSAAVGENMLETVIRHRVGCQLPTIITSNIDASQIGVGYGGHTESLLSECSIPLLVQGSDVRRSMQERELDEMKRGLIRPVRLA